MANSVELPGALVSTDWLHENLGADNLKIIDATVDGVVQEDGTFAIQSGREGFECNHVPGAQFADILDGFSDKTSDLSFTIPSAADFAKEVGALGVSNDSRVVVYSRTYTGWATRLWWLFRTFGFHNVAILDGGFAKWDREGKPISDEVAPVDPAEFRAEFVRSELATVEDVLEVTDGDSSACLVDSLPTEYFHGKAGDTYGYGRLGHIPGAINIPTETLLNPETGEFLPVAELEKSFADLPQDDSRQLITYCGGGIAATQNSFVLHLLGRDNVAMYDGSLQDWVQDEGRPLSVD